MDPTNFRKARIGAAIVSVLIYAVLCGSHLDPKVRKKSVEAFGSAPMGMPVTAVVIAGETILYLPMPFVFYHMMILVLHSQQEGGWAPRGLFSLLVFLVEAEYRFPELKRSMYICVVGLVYVASLVAVWLWYTSRLAI